MSLVSSRSASTMDPQISVQCISPLTPSHAPHCAEKQGLIPPVDCGPLCSGAQSLCNSSEPLEEKRPTDATEVAVTLINLRDGFTASQSNRSDDARPAPSAKLHEVIDHSPLVGSHDAQVLSSPFTFAYPFPPPATIEAIPDGKTGSVVSSTCKDSLDGADSTSPASTTASIAGTHDAADHGETMTVDPLDNGLPIPTPVSTSANDVDGAQAAADSSVVLELHNDTPDATFTESADTINASNTTLEAPSTFTPPLTNAVPSLQPSVECECGPISHFKILLLSTTSLLWLSVMSVLFVCNLLRRVTKKSVYLLGDN